MQRLALLSGQQVQQQRQRRLGGAVVSAAVRFVKASKAQERPIRRTPSFIFPALFIVALLQMRYGTAMGLRPFTGDTTAPYLARVEARKRKEAEENDAAMAVAMLEAKERLEKEEEAKAAGGSSWWFSRKG
jgi:hypothetical protein